MGTPTVCVLRAPGTNCDIETAHAFEISGANAERVHVNRLLENPQLLDSFQILCIPGGFSYGDDIGAGVIFSQQMSGKLGDTLQQFLSGDRLVLGICNGFQVLLKSGILPDGVEGLKTQTREDAPATLTWNDSGKYTARWVKLGIASSKNVFLTGIDEIELPIAHAEGKLVVRDAAVVDQWRENGQIAMCYRGAEANANADELVPYPDNPNGSVANIAGLGDPTGRVLGLMPHPERFIHATQHPCWTRDGLRGDGAGLQLFQNAVNYFG